MASIGDFFGKGSIGEQLLIWGVFQQVLGTLIQPGLNEIGYLENEAFTNVVMTPADLADAVVRNFRDHGDAAGDAAKSGIGGDDFDTLVHLAGDAPAPQELAAALRRAIIAEGGVGPDSTSFTQGIAEGRLADKWAPVIQALAKEWPTPTDAIAASVQGFYDDAQASAAYEKFGGDPQFYQLLHYIHGDAPSPGELLQLLNRGIIPADSGSPTVPGYAQGIRQGRLRNEWLEPIMALRAYLTPPRTVTAMYREGVLTRDQAVVDLKKHGVPDDMIPAYLAAGTRHATAKAKELTETQVVAVYEAHILPEAQAHELLTALGYNADDATLILRLADLRRAISAVTTAAKRVQTLYITHKITRDAAQHALTALEIPAPQITEMLAVWDLELSVTVKQLTEAQIADAWKENIISQDEAIAELQHIGYTAYDAWLLLSIKGKSALSNKPNPGPNPVGVIP